jgi:hypothetical protein
LLGNGALDGSPGAVSCSSGALKSATLSPPTVMCVHYTHLLRMQSDGTEILRGRTSWRLKQRYNNSSSNNNGASHWVSEWVLQVWFANYPTQGLLNHVELFSFGAWPSSPFNLEKLPQIGRVWLSFFGSCSCNNVKLCTIEIASSSSVLDIPLKVREPPDCLPC